MALSKTLRVPITSTIPSGTSIFGGHTPRNPVAVICLRNWRCAEQAGRCHGTRRSSDGHCCGHCPSRHSYSYTRCHCCSASARCCPVGIVRHSRDVVEPLVDRPHMPPACLDRWHEKDSWRRLWAVETPSRDPTLVTVGCRAAACAGDLQPHPYGAYAHA